ncbi:hypothetical protein [Streptomyces sp. NPDC088674]|uniref:hypothetical protein n=1 Tax=Streptomyces sp. NPDC088674 TaxID=3365869 RepID=UPI0038263776
MACFVDTLRYLSSWRSVSLTTQSPLLSAELSRGYVYQQWVHASPQNRDRHRYLLALRNRRSPFALILEEAGHDPARVEHLHDGQPAKGIGAAHLMNGLAISLPVSPKWSTSWLNVDIQRLGEDDVEYDMEHVRHCSTPDEAVEHESWARNTGLHALSTPTELLAAWDEFFPSLERLPRFDRDMSRLDTKWFRAVRELLAELQSTAADHWDLCRSPEPDWQNPHITPESQSRSHLCTFTDPASDDLALCFSWHGRMTPGKGRLYFRLVPERKTFRLAYVGPKPGSDRES